MESLHCMPVLYADWVTSSFCSVASKGSGFLAAAGATVGDGGDILVCVLINFFLCLIYFTIKSVALV